MTESRIVAIYNFLKTNDKTRAALNTYLVTNHEMAYAYANNLMSALCAVDVLIKKGGYLIFNPELAKGL